MASLTGNATRDDTFDPFTISDIGLVDWVVNSTATIRKSGGGSQITIGGTANDDTERGYPTV